MRVSIELELSNPEFGHDYRRAFMSLIKAAFQKESDILYKKMYETKTDKPFTFSVFFPELKGDQNKILFVGKKAILNFSTNDTEIVVGLYNGIYKLKSYTYKSDQTFNFIRADLKPLKNFKTNTQKFKTLSPILINKKGDNLKFLSLQDYDFQDALKFSVKEICSHFLNIDNPEFDIRFLKHQKMVLTHYNQYMTTNKGIIEITANSDVLKLLYDTGIGVRRSQGFGMLEMV